MNLFLNKPPAGRSLHQRICGRLARELSAFKRSLHEAMNKDLGEQRKLLEKVKKLRFQGRAPQAMQILEEEPCSEALKPHVLACLAELHFYFGNPQKALECAVQALELGYDYCSMAFVQALSLRVLGESDKAAALLHSILEKAPEHKGAKDVLLLMEGKSVRPETEEKLLRLRKMDRPLVISVRSPSDKENDPEMLPLWGDYWVKVKLEQEFTQMGLVVSQENPDIILHFLGLPPKSMPEHTYNIVWNYSHPDIIDPEILRRFDKITCAAVDFIPKLEAYGYLKPELLPACTSKTPYKTEPVYDIVFLGNARLSRPDGRGVVADMLAAGLDFKVWGYYWDRLLPEKYYGGKYWEYDRLEELYAGTRITLNDHHPDMAREGYVSNKVFDILASGGFVISQSNAGLKPLFGDSVPEYETPEQLKKLAGHYLDNPEEREALRLKGRQAALRHTYRKCAERLLSDLLP